ncbi:MAG TPA: hypothetical protein VKT77_19220, partial [Chthonomonadaceae bacterium]|nr:hypothetical protein [Chthonomonadaceae bacterium]
MQTQRSLSGMVSSTGWARRGAWWLAAAALAAITLWALPGRVIQLNADQLHRMVGSSHGGYWTVTVSYEGTASDTFTEPGPGLPSGPYENIITADSSTTDLGMPRGTMEANLNSLDANTSSTAGGLMGRIKMQCSAAGLLFLPSPGSFDELLQLSGAKIRYTLVWNPAIDANYDPAPENVMFCYKRTVTAHGERSGGILITSTSGDNTDSLGTPVTTTDTLWQKTIVNTSGGTGSVAFDVTGSIHIQANGGTMTPLHYGADYTDYRIDVAIPGYVTVRGVKDRDSGNNPVMTPDPSFTRWLPLSFSPQLNTQPIRFQPGALPAPWGNVSCFYSMSIQQEPTPPNYDVDGQTQLYISQGYGSVEMLPGDFVPYYTITDANGDRLSFNQSLTPYRDIHSSLTAGGGLYVLSGAGPPGSLKQAGHYSYTFTAAQGRLVSIQDDAGNQQFCSWGASDPILTVSDFTSGRSLVFHGSSINSYFTSVDAIGPTGLVNTHTTLSWDGGGHLTALNVYDGGGLILLNQAATTYGGANGDSILTQTDGVGTTAYTYMTDANMVDPFGLATDRLASSIFGSDTDSTSSDDGGSIKGTASYTWGPTLMGYDNWGIQARTNTFTDPRGNVFQSVFTLSGDTYGPINSYTYTGPDFAGAPGGSNVARVLYGPDIVQPTSITLYDQLYNSGVTHDPWIASLDTYGNLTCLQDPLLHRWQLAYSADHTHLVSATDPTNLTWTLNYGEGGAPGSRLTSVTDPAGTVRGNVAYNVQGQPVTITTPAAISATGTNEAAGFGYHPTTGDLLTITDPLGDILQYTSYDALGDPLSAAVYPDTGNPATSLTPITGSVLLNSAQQATVVTAGNGLQTVGGYTNGILTQLQTLAPQASGGTAISQTNLSYDSRGRLYKVADSIGTIVQYRFDKSGNRTKTIDGAGHTSLAQFGSNNEVTSVTWPGGQSAGISYNADGSVREIVDERGVVRDYVYYADGRTSDVQFPASPAKNIHYTYDPAGRLLSVTDSTGSRSYAYDAVLKRLQSVTTVISALPAGHNTFVVSYAYNGDGSVASVTSPVGTTSYTRNAAGQVVFQADALGHNTAWTFDHAGRTLTRDTTSPTGTHFLTSYGYGGSNLPGDTSTAPFYLSSITQSVAGAAAWTFSLQHAYTGQITGIVGTGAQPGQALSATFGYDSRGRITGEQQTYNTDASHAYSKTGAFQYDSAGNLQGGAGGWTYNSNNQVTNAPAAGGLSGASGLSYDAAGDLTGINGVTLVYDDLGALVEAQNTSIGTIDYTVNADGQRVSRTVGGVTTFYLYDCGVLIATLDSTGAITRSYSWGQDGLLADSSPTGWRDYSFDPVGNTSSIWSAAGISLWQGAFSAFGDSLTGDEPDTGFGYEAQEGGYADMPNPPIRFATSGGGAPYVPSLGRMAMPSSPAAPNAYS